MKVLIAKLQITAGKLLFFGYDETSKSRFVNTDEYKLENHNC